MKIKFQSLLVALLFFAGMSCTNAQGQPGGPDRDPAKMAERHTKRMAETVTLSPAQYNQVQAIHLKYAQQRQALRPAKGAADADRAAAREKMKALRTAQETELKAVLTADQWSAWEKARPEKRGKGRRGGEDRAGAPDLDPAQAAERQTARMAEKLTLTEAQRTKVQAIHLNYARQMQAARPAPGAAETDRAAAKAKMDSLRTAKQAELKAVLSPEQWAAWEKAGREGRGKHGGKKGKGSRTPE